MSRELKAVIFGLVLAIGCPASYFAIVAYGEHATETEPEEWSDEWIEANLPAWVREYPDRRYMDWVWWRDELYPVPEAPSDDLTGRDFVRLAEYLEITEIPGDQSIMVQSRRTGVRLMILDVDSSSLRVGRQFPTQGKTFRWDGRRPSSSDQPLVFHRMILIDQDRLQAAWDVRQQHQ